MPALRNVRNERFCQAIATSPKTGWPQGRCYVEAGYKTADRSADACAARLLTRANIQARIAELVEPTVRKTRATVDTLAEQLDAVFAGALNAEQFSAAGNAAGLKARLLGFMREKIEIGSAGEFDRCTTVRDVVEMLLAREPAAELLASIDAFREEIVRYAADHATLIEAEPARPQAPGCEVELALADLRPQRRRR